MSLYSHVCIDVSKCVHVCPRVSSVVDVSHSLDTDAQYLQTLLYSNLLHVHNLRNTFASAGIYIYVCTATLPLWKRATNCNPISCNFFVFPNVAATHKNPTFKHMQYYLREVQRNMY